MLSTCLEFFCFCHLDPKAWAILFVIMKQWAWLVACWLAKCNCSVVYLNYFRAINLLQFGQAVTDPLRVHPPFQQVQHIACTEQAGQHVSSVCITAIPAAVRSPTISQCSILYYISQCRSALYNESTKPSTHPGTYKKKNSVPFWVSLVEQRNEVIQKDSLLLFTAWLLPDMLVLKKDRLR